MHQAESTAEWPPAHAARDLWKSLLQGTTERLLAVTGATNQASWEEQRALACRTRSERVRDRCDERLLWRTVQRRAVRYCPRHRLRDDDLERDHCRVRRRMHLRSGGLHDLFQ